MKNEVLVVLPKVSSYSSMDFERKQIFELKLGEYIGKIRSWGKQAVCFAEDFLAVKIFSCNAEVKWLSLLIESDVLFMKNNPDTDLPKEYGNIKLDYVSSDIRKLAAVKHAAPRLSSFDDEATFLKVRRDVVTRRIRCAANEYLGNVAKFIIYIDAKNNYCNMPAMGVGVPKKVICENLVDGTCMYYYGGIAVDLNTFAEIMSKEAEL